MVTQMVNQAGLVEEQVMVELGRLDKVLLDKEILVVLAQEHLAQTGMAVVVAVQEQLVVMQQLLLAVLVVLALPHL
jgi:hypothetical protein